jgi:hypothetical protein
LQRRVSPEVRAEVTSVAPLLHLCCSAGAGQQFIRYMSKGAPEQYDKQAFSERQQGTQPLRIRPLLQ